MAKINIAPIFHLGLLKISGPDTVKLLQGQTTADYDQHPTDQYAWAAACTPKGRVYSNFISIPVDEGFLLLMAMDLIPETLKRLNKYAVFYKVTLEDVSKQWHLLGVEQDDQHVFGTLDKAQSVAVSDTEISLAWPGKRKILALNPLNAGYDDRLEALTEHYTFLTSEHWQKGDIEAGIPWVTDANLEEFIPQNLNLQAFDGISFSKGCYTGQEIVARMEYKGKLKSWAHLATSAQPLKAGDKIVNADGRALGTVINSADLSALVMVQHQATESDLFGPEDNPIKIQNLPYTV